MAAMKKGVWIPAKRIKLVKLNGRHVVLIQREKKRKARAKAKRRR